MVDVAGLGLPEALCKTAARCSGEVIAGGQSDLLAGATWERHPNFHYNPGCAYPAGLSTGFYSHGGKGAEQCAKLCLNDKSGQCTGFHLRLNYNWNNPYEMYWCQFCKDALKSQKPRTNTIPSITAYFLVGEYRGEKRVLCMLYYVCCLSSPLA